jgi:hypothetical protein
MTTKRSRIKFAIALFATGCFCIDARSTEIQYQNGIISKFIEIVFNNRRQSRHRHRRNLIDYCSQQQHRNLRRMQNVFDSEITSDDDGSAPARLIIDPLTILLTPTIEVLMPNDIETILSAMETAISDYLQSKKEGIIPADLVFVRLGNTYYNGTHGTNTTASIAVDKGVASFTGPPVFTKDEAEVYKINSWIHDSLNSFDLVDYLFWLNESSPIGKVSNNLMKVRTVSYEFLDVSPPSTSLNQTGQPISNGIQSESQQAPLSGRSKGTIIMFALLGFVMISLLALLIVRRQRSTHAELVETESGIRAADSGDSESDMEPQRKSSPTLLTGKVRLLDDGKSPKEKRSYRQSPILESKRIDPDTTTTTTPPTDTKETPTRDRNSDTSGSLVSSDGQWTMPTEDGDSATLKPIRDLGHAAMSPRLASFLTPSPTTSAAGAAALVNANLSLGEKTQSNVSSADSSLQNLGMATADSFELDRHINVRKDMLVSVWSSNARAHPAKVNAASSLYTPNQSITVLQPSYFSASQEHRARHAASAMQTKDEFHLSDIETIMNNPVQRLLGISTSTSDEDEDDGTTDESTKAAYYQNPQLLKNSTNANNKDDECNTTGHNKSTPTLKNHDTV